MLVGKGPHSYEWIEKWARVPETESAKTGWAHHGIVVSSIGVIAFHQADPTVLIFDDDGTLKSCGIPRYGMPTA